MRCETCKISDVPMVKTGRNGDKVRYRCNPCNRALCNKYRSTEKGKLALKRSISKYERTHPERKQAWIAARDIAKSACTICGDLRVHRHHPDPMKKLDVIFLCPYHHNQAHKV